MKCRPLEVDRILRDQELELNLIQYRYSRNQDEEPQLEFVTASETFEDWVERISDPIDETSSEDEDNEDPFHDCYEYADDSDENFEAPAEQNLTIDEISPPAEPVLDTSLLQFAHSLPINSSLTNFTWSDIIRPASEAHNDVPEIDASTLSKNPWPGVMKHCFVTIGATAAFPELIKAVLSSECLDLLIRQDFTHLTIQCGTSMDVFAELEAAVTWPNEITILAFDFKPEGLTEEMRRCQLFLEDGNTESRATGLVISHAGSGSIMEALRLDVPLLVIPNESLLDNHQVELADELERQGYATKGDTKDLVAGIRKAVTWTENRERRPWGGASASFPAIIDQVVGYEADVQAQLD